MEFKIATIEDGFSPETYRAYNLDLRELGADLLRLHFETHQYEARIYGAVRTTSEFMSMRWLRGSGMEVGAGGHPTKLFGNATAMMNDCDPDLVFGGEKLDFKASVDDEKFSYGIEKRFDFTIASHVLEHADSFLRAIKNLIDVTKKGGFIYLVLPDIEFIHDNPWMPRFDIEHHIAEFSNPLKHADLHDTAYINGTSNGIGIDENAHATLSKTYTEAVIAGKIPSELRFVHHKHNYSFEDWTKLFFECKNFLSYSFNIVDIRYGYERMDCHYILRVA